MSVNHEPERPAGSAGSLPEALAALDLELGGLMMLAAEVEFTRRAMVRYPSGGSLQLCKGEVWVQPTQPVQGSGHKPWISMLYLPPGAISVADDPGGWSLELHKDHEEHLSDSTLKSAEPPPEKWALTSQVNPPSPTRPSRLVESVLTELYNEHLLPRAVRQFAALLLKDVTGRPGAMQSYERLGFGHEEPKTIFADFDRELKGSHLMMKYLLAEPGQNGVSTISHVGPLIDPLMPPSNTSIFVPYLRRETFVDTPGFTYKRSVAPHRGQVEHTIQGKELGEIKGLRPGALVRPTEGHVWQVIASLRSLNNQGTARRFKDPR